MKILKLEFPVAEVRNMTKRERLGSASAPYGAHEPSAESEQATPPGVRSECSEVDPGYTDSWMLEITEAAALAGEVDTPEAWQSVTTAAEVLVEIAQTLEITTEAKQRARRLEMSAERAGRESHEAAKEAVDAKREAEQLAQAAQDAIGEAAAIKQRAEQLAQALQELTRRVENTVKEAAKAEQRAEQLAQAEQDVTQRAEDAAREADEAKESARQMEKLMAQAHEINSVAAWNETLRRVSAARVTGDTTAAHQEQGHETEAEGPSA